MKKIGPVQVRSDKSEKYGINTKNGDIVNYRNKYHKKEDIHTAGVERYQ